MNTTQVFSDKNNSQVFTITMTTQNMVHLKLIMNILSMNLSNQNQKLLQRTMTLHSLSHSVQLEALHFQVLFSVASNLGNPNRCTIKLNKMVPTLLIRLKKNMVTNMMMKIIIRNNMREVERVEEDRLKRAFSEKIY